MSYTQAITELRQLLGDTDKDKRSSRKKLIGNVDGDNKKFRAYDKRIVEDTLEIFVNGTIVPFSLDSANSSEIILNSAPEPNSKIEASYYWQWWNDDELKTFLKMGAESLGVVDETNLKIWETVPDGLRGSLLYYAASHSVRRQIMFMINRRHSGEFLLEQDKGGDEGFAELIKALEMTYEMFAKTGKSERDDFIQKRGQQKNPAFKLKAGSSGQYGPRK